MAISLASISSSWFPSLAARGRGLGFRVLGDWGLGFSLFFGWAALLIGLSESGSSQWVSGLLGGPWGLVTTYNWDYIPTYNWGDPYRPI